MKKIGFLLVFFLSFQTAFTQNIESDKLMEYDHRDSLEIIANIFIPSFEFVKEEYSPIIIERKDVLWFELHFIKSQQEREINNKDTCFIAIYNEKDWEGIDPKYAELSCVNDDENCHFLINDTGNYAIRFRKGTKIKSYKLIIR